MEQPLENNILKPRRSIPSVRWRSIRVIRDLVLKKSIKKGIDGVRRTTVVRKAIRMERGAHPEIHPTIGRAHGHQGVNL